MILLVHHFYCTQRLRMVMIWFMVLVILFQYQRDKIVAAAAGAEQVDCPQDCSCNFGRTVEIAVDCTGLTSVTLRHVLAGIPEDTAFLSLRHSSIKDVSILGRFKNVRRLDLSFNRIESVVAYKTFLDLTYLNLKSNRLKVLRKDEFSSFPNLEILDLDNNQIISLHSDTFKLLQLKQLYLSNNNIQYIAQRTFRWLHRLEVLSLEGNHMRSLLDRNFFFLPNLTELDLSYNQITGIGHQTAFKPLYRLRTLNLAFNNLTAVPTSALLPALPALVNLYLDGNEFRVLKAGDFYRSTSLTALHLSHCPKLVLILNGTFSGTALPNLRFLNISHNARLAYMSEGAIRAPTALNRVDLSNNTLYTVPSSLFGIKSLSKVNVDGNRLICPCLPSSALYKPSGRCYLPENGDKKTDIRTWLNSHSNSDKDNKEDSNCVGKVFLTSETDSILPVPIGSSYTFYCAHYRSRSQTKWTLPNGTVIWEKVESGSGHLLNSPKERIEAHFEQLHFRYISTQDSGTFQCSDGVGSSRLQLSVSSPSYALSIHDIGTHYASLAWNETLVAGARIITNNGDREGKTRFVLRYWASMSEGGDSEDGGSAATTTMPLSTYERTIPPATFWRGYAVKGLASFTNYTFCLIYEYYYNNINKGDGDPFTTSSFVNNVTLYSSCVDGQTGRPLLGARGTLNYAILLCISLAVGFGCMVCSARCLHKRFHVWQEEKYRSRMAESISGQSFLSSADSLHSSSAGSHSSHRHGIVAFENNSSSHHNLSLNIYPKPSASSSSARTQQFRGHKAQTKSLPLYKSPEVEQATHKM